MILGRVSHGSRQQTVNLPLAGSTPARPATMDTLLAVSTALEK